MQIEVSNGEVVDRAVILEIKLEKLFLDHHDRSRITGELEELWEVLKEIGITKDSDSYMDLKQINEFLWDAVKEQKESSKTSVLHHHMFRNASLRVVRLNQDRFEIKCNINMTTQSQLHELKE